MFSSSVFAQEGLGPHGETEPVRYKDDAKAIFMQDFESASKVFNTMQLNMDPNRPTTLYTWLTQPVDSITEIKYYKRINTDSPSGKNIYDGSDEWKIAGVRTDSIIYMYDGIMRTDAIQPDDSLMQWDEHAIMDHSATTQAGSGIGGADYGLDRFGEDGGNQYFKYVSKAGKGINGKKVANYSDDNKAVPEYRRNLFIRNIPIEEESSYRVTVFVKGQKIGASSPTPRIGLDLMRGYFHSEKSFIVNSVGREQRYGSYVFTSYDWFADKTDYKINDGADEENKWQKVTLMAYYNNDSIGAASPYIGGYYWADDWDWHVNVDAEGYVTTGDGTPAVLKYIEQPAKFFVRLSFRSDSTEFWVDNLSLTKSWIGGVEHYNDMIRVDMGYQTNMGDLAQAALEANKIAAVELPGQYFDVWAKWGDTWEYMDILSAEYHGDGYMYMWTMPYEDGEIRNLTDADSVLVTFRNPKDRDDLKLKYTGNAYPNGFDVEWQNDKNKRLVYDFHNEISALNPTIVKSPKDKKPVRSLKNVPPVFQDKFEDGTFGLDPQTRSFTFKFSRNLYFDNSGATSNYSIVTLKKGGTVEYWDIADYGDIKDGTTTITRPAKYTGALSGDYELKFSQVTHLNTADPDNSDDYAANVVLNIHFGNFDENPNIAVVANSNWRNDLADSYKELSNKRPIPTSVYIHTGTETFQKGIGEEVGGNKCGFYNAPKNTITVFGTQIPDDGMFYLSNRKDGVTGNLYSIVNLNKGDYEISFKFGGHSTTDIPMVLKFYAKPSGTLEDGNDKGFATLEAVEDKVVLEEGRKPAVNQGGSYSTTTAWKDGIETVSYKFSVPANGDYVFEWVAAGASDYKGFCISNYWITNAGDLSLSPVSKINDAISAAATKIAAANAGANNRYKGAAYDNLVSVKSTADGFIAAKKATNINKPSEYAAEAKTINDAVELLKVRMDTVDAFYKAIDSLQFKINQYGTADSLVAYQGFPEIAAAQTFKNGYASFTCSDKTSKAIQAETDKVYAEMKKLDNRLSLALKFADAISFASDMKDSADVKGIDATELEAAITAANSYDVVTNTYDVVRAEMQALTDLALATAYGDDIKALSVRRINELKALADNLEASYATVTPGAELDAILARIQNVDFDDDELADIIKAAINLKIYQKIAAGESVDSIDLTPYIKNYYLYATVKGYVDNSDLQLPGSRNDARAQALQGAAQIQKIAHEWGNDALDKKIWVLVLEQEYTDLFPGWTAKSFVTGNHSMFTPDNENYTRLSKDTLVFDGQIGMDWNSKAELKTVVTGLPAGVYSLSLDANGRANTNNTKITLSTNSEETKVTASKAGAIEVKADGFRIEEGTLDIDLTVETANGGFDGDNFKLMYLGKIDSPFFEPYYATLLQNAQKTLDKLITVVDASEAVAGDVEFFTLGGVQLDAPIENQVILRKTTQNGNVVVEKVIYK